MKHLNKMFFMVALVMLVIGLSTAAYAADDTTTESIISESPTDNTVEHITAPTGSDTTVKNDNKIINKTTNENVKTDTSTVNYYVSDTNGLDTNNGTQSAPFKTIQTALDKTTGDKTYNIYIGEGTYKGLGNTNLTVNGNNRINFIGSGINTTILDGQAHFDIDPNPGYVWGSSEIWWPYLNESGDYSMTITQGTGLIGIENMTISNMYCKGGWAISLYEHAPIDNYANLNVNNVCFDSNHGGCGSAIRNNRGGTLTINNSLFMNNSKAGSLGNNGIVYNNGTATILNTVFDHNYARWASVLNDHNLTCINTTFKNGQAYDGSSGYKYGTGIGANSGNADYYNEYFLLTHTNIVNCTFLNNEQNDIYVVSGNFNLTGNKFINTTGITLTDSVSSDIQTYVVIDKNVFENMQPASITETLLSHKNTFAIDAEGYSTSDITISNNYIDSENGTLIKVRCCEIINNTIKAKKEMAISSSGNNTITGNIISGSIGLKGNYDTIKNNQIYTDKEYAIFDSGARNSVISDNQLVSYAYLGDYSVEASSTRNTIENNTPVMPDDFIYVSFEATEADLGTPDNPTTIQDALQKVENNQTISLLATKNTTLSSIDTININTDTVKTGTKNFTITSLTNNMIFNRNNNLDKGNIFNISEGFSITLENIGFENMGTTTEGMGGAIYSEGNLYVNNCNFNNTKALYGGAIFVNKYADITIKNSTFNNIQSPNECLYLNTIGKKTLENNKYQNSSVNINLQIQSNNTYNHLNKIIYVNITDITVVNPNFYDNNILNDITYNIYLNDKLVNTTKDRSFEVPPRGAESKIYVIPEFTNVPSNTLILESNFNQEINVTLNTPTKTTFTDLNENLETTILDEFGEKILRGKVSYYNGQTLITTSNVEDGKSTCTIPEYSAGEYEITVKYEDESGLYQNTTNKTQLIILDEVYVSPSIITPQAGTKNNPTTIQDALSKIKNNHTILLLNQENKKYRLNQTININNNTVQEKVTSFTITGENIIIDAGNSFQLMNISKDYNIVLNNITFTNGLAANGAAINSQANLTLNNTKFYNNKANNNAGAIQQNKGQLTIINNEFINNTAQNKGAAILTNNTIVTITNTKFINSTSSYETLYLNNSENKLNNNTYAYNTIEFKCNSTLETENTPIQLNDIVSITTTNITLTNPSYYDDDLLEKTTYGLYYNNELINTYDINTATLTMNKVGDNEICLIPSFGQDKSSTIIADVELNHLKNTVITAEEAVTEVNNNAIIKVTIKDKNGDLVTGEGQITVYNEKGEIIGTKNTDNGIAEITTTTFTQGGIFNLNIQYNTTETYNNQTNTSQVIVKFKDVYVRPSITTPQEGTIDNPTTIQDALQKVAQGGTIHFLKDDNNIYYIEETIIINTTTTKNITTLTLQAETNDITLDGQYKTRILKIAPNITLEIKNISFIYGYVYIDEFTADMGGAIYNEGNLTINGTSNFNYNYAYQGGAIYTTGPLTITGNNTFYKNSGMTIVESRNANCNIIGNNKFIENYGAVYGLNTNLTIIGSNIFQENEYSGRVLITGAAIRVAGAKSILLINGTNIFENNRIYGGENAQGGAIYGTGYIIIEGKNQFINNSAVTSVSKGQGGAIYANNGLNIIGENYFLDNYSENGGTIFVKKGFNITGNNTFIDSSASRSGGIIYMSSGNMLISGNNILCNSSSPLGGAIDYEGTNDIIITGNMFENITAESGGIIYTGKKANSITLTNNTIRNIQSDNETIYFKQLPTSTSIADNTYTNCSIKLVDFIISSELEGQTLPQNTPITINMTAQLLHPEFYDADIMDKTTYYLYVNDENKYETTDNSLTIKETYPKETSGKLNIYSNIGENTQSNNLTITIQKPLNTTIEIITPKENTVNKTTPITIIITDEDYNIVKDVELTFTTNDGNETLNLPNGVMVYKYTPTTIGEETITLTYNGNDTLNPTSTTITLTVTPNKDAIIEELNNTIQEMNKNCILTIDNIPDIKFNDNLTLTGKLMDTKGSRIANTQITVNVNGVDNTVTTDANGVWKLKVKTTTLGTNNVTATYSGTQYNPFATSTTFEISQTEAIITIDKIVTTQFRDNVTITGTFKNSNGKAIANSKVRVNVNGYSTYVTTDHYGVWSLTLKTNKTGVNNVTVSFSGNANYAKYTANATFNVTKQDLVITTEVKYNKGNFTITGTFVDKNGNKLSNSKIRVNINGKAVYVKTDSNGTYTYSELVTAKTIKYNVYYGGSANYNSYTSSKTTLTVA